MKVHEYLKESHIILDLEPGEKRHVLEKFVSALKKRGLISKEKVILDELLKREALGSTGLEKGIAVPHALIKKIKEPIVALALIKEGIDFKAVDQMPTYIVLVLLGDKDNPGFQLKLLAHICRMVKETDFVENVKTAETSQDVWSILKDEEDKI
ncbi:MAG: PTS sugar transporter subunit IIA [Candidatus Aminicenantes bacterium]|nr:MAG: PTS sugar transporter subunit IIA [Candidatus Aminicenantes bacterium]